MLSLLLALVFPALMAYAAFSDLFTMRISNWLVIAVGVTYFALALVAQLDWALIGWASITAAATLAVAFAFFAFGWIGGGDAKLAASTALWLGWSQLLEYAVYSSLLGGLLTMAVLHLRGAPLHPPFLMREGWYARITDEKTGIPYGIALAAAGLVLYPASIWMSALPL